MTIKKRPMTADGTSAERRKSRRFPVVVPIEVSWRGSNGISVKEDAVARQVNANGGFLKMANYPALGSRVTLANFLSAQTAEARVLAAPDSRQGVANGIVVELIVPSESFWGVDLQVNKAIVELQNLEEALRGQDLNLELVREYRDAVDYIRTTTETLQQLRKGQLRGSQDGEVLSVLAIDRIRRTGNLCLEVVADLDAGRIRLESKGIEELQRALQLLQKRLRQAGNARTRSIVEQDKGYLAMRIPVFEIFSGSADKDALWIESVEGLGAANDRMKQIAAEKPGRYFIFSMHDRAILGSINTSRTRDHQTRKDGEVA